MAYSADPDQLASSEAIWSGSALFEKEGITGFSRTSVENPFKVRTWALSLIDWVDLVDFLRSLKYKVDNFCDFLFAFLYTKSNWKEVYSNTNEFAPNGGKYIYIKYTVIPFIVHPSQCVN